VILRQGCGPPKLELAINVRSHRTEVLFVAAIVQKSAVRPEEFRNETHKSQQINDFCLGCVGTATAQEVGYTNPIRNGQMSHVLDQPILELNSNDPPSIESETLAERPPENGKSFSKGARILVVDDNHTIADPLAFVLWFEGFTAKAAHSGMEAIAAAQEFKPELLISDVMMPDMLGTEAAVRVSLMLPSCKVILFSGDATGKELVRPVRQQGFEFQFLEKPLHPQKLISHINLLLPC